MNNKDYLNPYETSSKEAAKRLAYEFVRDNVIVAVCLIPAKIILKDKLNVKSALIGISVRDIFGIGCVLAVRKTNSEDNAASSNKTNVQ